MQIKLKEGAVFTSDQCVALLQKEVKAEAWERVTGFINDPDENYRYRVFKSASGKRYSVYEFYRPNYQKIVAFAVEGVVPVLKTENEKIPAHVYVHEIIEDEDGLVLISVGGIKNQKEMHIVENVFYVHLEKSEILSASSSFNYENSQNGLISISINAHNFTKDNLKDFMRKHQQKSFLRWKKKI